MDRSRIAGALFALAVLFGAPKGAVSETAGDTLTVTGTVCNGSWCVRTTVNYVWGWDPVNLRWTWLIVDFEQKFFPDAKKIQ